MEDAKAEATLDVATTLTETPSSALGRDTKKTDKDQEDRPPTRSTSPGRATNIKVISTVEVPVGISRLHLTSLPALQMKPLYWSPVNDIAIVTRATWFYR